MLLLGASHLFGSAAVAESFPVPLDYFGTSLEDNCLASTCYDALLHNRQTCQTLVPSRAQVLQNEGRTYNSPTMSHEHRDS